MNKPLKPLLLVGNNTAPETRKALEESGLFDIITASIGKFVSGEPFAELHKGEEKTYGENLARLKGSKVYVLQSTSEPVADSFQHLLLMAHTLKYFGAGDVTAICPFAAGLRQDRAFKDRFTSVAAVLFAQQMKAAGIDGVITMTPHSKGAIAEYTKVFGDRFKPLATTVMFAEDIKKRFGSDPEYLCIGAPDGADKATDEGQTRARELTKAVFGRADDDCMFRISKTHTGVNNTKITSFDGDVAGKDCVIIDDMIDGGSTMNNAAAMLKAQGARSVTCYATHGILTNNALEKLLEAKYDGMHNAIDKIVITDSIPGAADKLAALLAQQPKLAGRVEILSVGDMAVQQAKKDIAPPAVTRPAPGPKASFGR